MCRDFSEKEIQLVLNKKRNAYTEAVVQLNIFTEAKDGKGDHFIYRTSVVKKYRAPVRPGK